MRTLLATVLGLAIVAVNRMITGAVRGVKAREARRTPQLVR